MKSILYMTEVRILQGQILVNEELAINQNTKSFKLMCITTT